MQSQVKLGEDWYYFDLTSCRDCLREGISIRQFLLSKKDFISENKYHIPLEDQCTYDSPNSFDKSILFTYIIENVESSKKDVVEAQKK